MFRLHAGTPEEPKMLLYAFIIINSLLTKHKPTETDLVPSFLLIVVQRVQVCYAGCLKELIISVSVIGTMPTVSTHTAHFICREAQDRAKLQKTCISFQETCRKIACWRLQIKLKLNQQKILYPCFCFHSSHFVFPEDILRLWAAKNDKKLVQCKYLFSALFVYLLNSIP